MIMVITIPKNETKYMKIASLIVILVATFMSTANAQDATVTMSMAEYKEAEAKTESLNKVIAKNQETIDSLNNILSARDSIIGQLNEQLKTVSDLHHGDESVIVALKDSLAARTNEIMVLKKEAASFDMVRLRYANGRLQLPFDQEKVNEAIELFNGISDETLKNDCQEILSWLRQYNSYLRDVQDLMQTLQSDKRRENKFEFEKWKSDALNSINRNRYLRDSQGHHFTIIYLDEILTLAKNRITKATNKSTVDLSDLIDRLQL